VAGTVSLEDTYSVSAFESMANDTKISVFSFRIQIAARASKKSNRSGSLRNGRPDRRDPTSMWRCSVDMGNTSPYRPERNER